MRLDKSFNTRKKNMRHMISALLTYSYEYQEKTEEVEMFLVENDFLALEKLEVLKKEIYRYLTNVSNDRECLYYYLNVLLIELLNNFNEPAYLKNSLQKEKNKILISFCKTTFEDEAFYKKLCGFK